MSLDKVSVEKVATVENMCSSSTLQFLMSSSREEYISNKTGNNVELRPSHSFVSSPETAVSTQKLSHYIVEHLDQRLYQAKSIGPSHKLHTCPLFTNYKLV